MDRHPEMCIRDSLYSEHKMKKDDKALMRVITPYISWTLENGLAFISLGDERKRLEKIHLQKRI